MKRSIIIGASALALAAASVLSAIAVSPLARMAGIPYLTSTTALELEALPRSLMVIGGGYIGCELAQMFARAGAAVTLVTRRRLLPEAELEVSAALTGYLQDEGIAIKIGLAYRGIVRTDDGVELAIAIDGEEQTIGAEQVLVTTGRSPNTKDLGLGEAGVTLAANGGIVVDERMRTTRPGVYAAGAARRST
ncbi:FAD-dependent oxidoreductase [Chelativorans sp. ZYF759]|uniref:FAD-dependent oxidoreductase n=1 Tax=Chelativorans sp. ZYF759 TaxID=2692213 RepID=UPI00145E5998|nr:FAD-dependent oxidoreductase [Chelativorans sp. ZYF759]NMG41643.1 FAD-dependent oxidoreductase [Chelativorans sp. ZYF759]